MTVTHRQPERWRDACATLMEIIDSYQDWRDAIPPGLADPPRHSGSTMCWRYAVWSRS
jgi:hypothetical protein